MLSSLESGRLGAEARYLTPHDKAYMGKYMRIKIVDSWRYSIRDNVFLTSSVRYSVPYWFSYKL